MKTNQMNQMNLSSNPVSATFEQEIKSACRKLDNDSILPVWVSPVKGSSTKGMIQLYNKTAMTTASSDFIKSAHEKAWDSKTIARMLKTMPVAMYAFYPSIYSSDTLGSVAIYGENAMTAYHDLKLKGYLFGHKILSIKVEIGARPFVDVKLRA